MENSPRLAGHAVRRMWVIMYSFFGNGHMRPVADLENRGGLVRFHVGTRRKDRTNFWSCI